MKLPRRWIDARRADIVLDAWPRIIRKAHAETPASASVGASRFSSPTAAFRVLYAAEDFSTAFAEAVVRDRFEGKQRRVLYRPYLEALSVTTIGSMPLPLVDLTGGGTYDLGIDTDASRARDHRRGQAFAQILHDTTDFVGILFDSRLTSRPCVAVFDRAFHLLTASKPVDLVRVAALAGEMARLGIVLVQKRGL